MKIKCLAQKCLIFSNDEYVVKIGHNTRQQTPYQNNEIMSLILQIMREFSSSLVLQKLSDYILRNRKWRKSTAVIKENLNKPLTKYISFIKACATFLPFRLALKEQFHYRIIEFFNSMHLIGLVWIYQCISEQNSNAS